MKYNFEFLKTSDFNKNVFSLFKGVIIAQIIGVIGALILAKIYGNEAFGFYNVFLSISGVITILLTLNLEQTIVISSNNKESKNIFNSLFFLILSISFFFFTITTIAKYYFSIFNEFYFLLITGVFGALLIAYRNNFEMFLTYNKFFTIQANTKIITSILLLIFQGILFYFFLEDGLIYGFLISLSVIFFFLFWHLRTNFNFPDFSFFLKSVNKYRNLIKFGLTSNLINSIANNLLPILIAAFFTMASTGVYAISLKIVLTPMLLLSSSISQVYFQKASIIFKTKPEDLFNFTKNIVLNNLLIMFTILVLINTIGLYFLNLFFDKSWDNINAYVLVLSFYIICRASFNPISYITTVVDKLKIELVFNIYLVCINLISIFIGYYYQNLLLTILIFSFFGGLGYIIILLYFLRNLKLLKKN